MSNEICTECQKENLEMLCKTCFGEKYFKEKLKEMNEKNITKAFYRGDYYPEHYDV